MGVKNTFGYVRHPTSADTSTSRPPQPIARPTVNCGSNGSSSMNGSRGTANKSLGPVLESLTVGGESCTFTVVNCVSVFTQMLSVSAGCYSVLSLIYCLSLRLFLSHLNE